MIEELKEFYKYRGLLMMITYRDIKVRYKQSVMGFMWAVLMPVMIVMSGVVIRYAYAVATHAPLKTADIASVAVKSLPWAFVASSIRFSCYSLTSNWSLVTKIYFPKEIFPVAAVFASLFDFLVASGALIVLLVILRVGVGISLVWLPLLLFAMIMISVGIGLIVSAGSLFFRDVKFIVEVFLTFGIFFTPVFYDARMLGDKEKWILLNPLSPIIEGFGACIVRHQSPNLPWLGYAIGVALASCLGGYVFFKHLQPAFAENI